MTGNLGSNWLSVHKSENPLSFHKHEGFIGYAPNPRVDENTDAEGNISLYSHLLLDWGGRRCYNTITLFLCSMPQKYCDHPTLSLAREKISLQRWGFTYFFFINAWIILNDPLANMAFTIPRWNPSFNISVDSGVSSKICLQSASKSSVIPKTFPHTRFHCHIQDILSAISLILGKWGLGVIPWGDQRDFPQWDKWTGEASTIN